MYHRVAFNPATGRHVVLVNLTWRDVVTPDGNIKLGTFRSKRQAYAVRDKLNKKIPCQKL